MQVCRLFLSKEQWKFMDLWTDVPRFKWFPMIEFIEPAACREVSQSLEDTEQKKLDLSFGDVHGN